MSVLVGVAVSVCVRVGVLVGVRVNVGVVVGFANEGVEQPTKNDVKIITKKRWNAAFITPIL